MVLVGAKLGGGDRGKRDGRRESEGETERGDVGG